jgi:CMP-N-acetylneuraminic acid synthetase
MTGNLKILVTIAARGGSKGIKNKNIRNLSDKPLIAYTIEQAVKWGKFERLIVSTDSQDIAKIAKEYGAEVPFMRPAELATDTASKIDTLRHAFIEAEKYYQSKFDVLLDLDATAPIRTIKDIDNIVSLFEKKRPASVISVVKASKNPYFNMVEEQADGTFSICKQLEKIVYRRQDVPSVYDMNASIYVYDREFIIDLANKTPFSNKVFAYLMPDISAVDIDTELDFRFNEFLIKEGMVDL